VLVHWLKRVGLAVVAAVFAVTQLVPVDRHNPSANVSMSIEMSEKVPAPVERVLRSSCLNCHSNRTSWPWYSYVAPVSWVVAHDVRAGRRKLNFSEWGAYSGEKREQKLEEICDQVINGDMPNPKYLWVHRSARPTSAEREAICQWTEGSRKY
jgi:hypothetical protein